MTETAESRPCRYCVANWAGMSTRGGWNGTPIIPSAEDCEHEYRDDPRVYALAEALARVFQKTRTPTEEQISWFLADADDAVDDFDPAPERWTVRGLMPCAADGEQGIDARVRICGTTYVALEGGKDARGQLVKLATFREWHRG